jgi:hypothetical protein
MRYLPAVFILAAAFLALPPFAAAQMGLPRDVVAAETIGPAQADQVGRYVGEWLPRLGSEDPRDIRTARDNLLMPLRERAVSVAFRQAYAERLLPGLQEHAQDERDLTVVNVMRIAGELATPNSIQLLEDKLRDARPAVRYAAVSGLGRIFATVRDYSPAIGSDGVLQLVARIGQRMQDERDFKILDVSIRALAAAMEIDRQNYETVRGAAFSALANAASARARAAGAQANDEQLQVLVRAGEISRDALSVVTPRLQLSEQAVREAAELSGHLIALVVRRVRAGDFPPGDEDARQVPAQLVAVSETSIILAATRLRVQASVQDLAAELRRAEEQGDREFFRKAVDLLGILTRPPFNFPPGHFIRQ